MKKLIVLILFSIPLSANAYVAYDPIVNSTPTTDGNRISNYMSIKDYNFIAQNLTTGIKGLCYDVLCTNHLQTQDTYFSTIQKITGVTYPMAFRQGSVPLYFGGDSMFLLDPGPDYLIEYTGISIINGKYKLDLNNGQSYYICLYDSLNGVQSSSSTMRFYAGDVTTDANFSCPLYNNGYENVNLNGTGGPPPIQPIRSSVNGLTCESKSFPDLDSVSWHNIGSGPVREDLSNTGSVRLKVSASTGSTRDYDLISITKSSDNDINPTIIPFGSLPYPGSLTEEAIIRSEGYLNISSYSSGALRSFNLIQMNAIGYLESGSSVSLYISRPDGTSSIGSKSWTGTDLTIGFPTYANRIGIKYLNVFNGIRIGSAPMILKTSCYKNFNVCKWVINNGSSDCVPGTAVNGIFLGQCSIAGSGSVYGSGSCVPTVDSSGQIIPPNPMAGGYVTLDASGAIIGTVNPPIQEQNQEEINSIFSCGFSDDDSWYKTLWNGLTCPVTVVGNIFNSAWDNISKTVNGISRINSVTNNIGFTGSESQPFTGSTNVIGNKLAEKLEDIGDSTKGISLVGKIYKMAYWALFVGFIVVAVIGTIIFLIKSKND